MRLFEETVKKIDLAKWDHETRPQTIERLVDVALRSIKEARNEP